MSRNLRPSPDRGRAHRSYRSPRSRRGAVDATVNERGLIPTASRNCIIQEVDKEDDGLEIVSECNSRLRTSTWGSGIGFLANPRGMSL